MTGRASKAYLSRDRTVVSMKNESITIGEVSEITEPDRGYFTFFYNLRPIRLQRTLMILSFFIVCLILLHTWLVYHRSTNELSTTTQIINNNTSSNRPEPLEPSTEQTPTVNENSPTTLTTTPMSASSTAETTPKPTTTTITAVTTTTITAVTTTTTTAATTTTTTPKPKEWGNLKICVLRAVLPKTDFWSDTDPFVKVTVGDRYLGKTDFIKNNRNPYWGAYFFADDVKVNYVINFEVYDKDVNREVRIDSANISIKKVLNDNKSGQVIVLPLYDTYWLYVEITWLPTR